jgi:hypothetical protein
MEIEDQICTLEQMEELEKLGFDTRKASAVWVTDGQYERCQWAPELSMHIPGGCFETQPTFTVADMLEMLPKKIYSKVYEYEYVLYIVKGDSNWSIDYRCEDYYCMREVHSKNLRDALVAELKILKENKEI